MIISIRQAQNVAYGLSALGAAVGIAFVAMFLRKHTPDAHLLFGATVAATASMAALMAGVILAVLEAMRRDAPAAPYCGRQTGRGAVDRDAAAQWLPHREVPSAKRLSIDEPRFCTQAQAACTCWSSCGGQSAEQLTVSATADVPSYACPAVLPIVHRHGIKDCPLTLPAASAGIAATRRLVLH